MIYKYFPKKLSNVLWGNREKYGLIPDTNDNDWKIWLDKGYTDFYQSTQNHGIGNWVNNLTSNIISKLNFQNKLVLEIGPGIIRHLKYIKEKPQMYFLCDREEKCLEMSSSQLKALGIPFDMRLIDDISKKKLPFYDNMFDIIISFNSLEHFFPLEKYLVEMKRVLKKGGLIIGGIPCEGGLVWGLGRFFTTRKYVHKNYKINYDKIICWEHPNFIDFIFQKLDIYFKKRYKKNHPFPFLPVDLSLTASFIYEKDS